jgi:hypothetical protein
MLRCACQYRRKGKMKNIISHDYTGEKEIFVPLIGFKVVDAKSVETDGDLEEVTVLTLVNEHHVAIDITVSDESVSVSESYAVKDDLSIISDEDARV